MALISSATVIRDALDTDLPFILGLSPVLSEFANLSWHSDADILKFQDNYTNEIFDKTDGPRISLIAENEGLPLGFIHACEAKDYVLGEICGTVPLLAVTKDAHNMGVGRMLMQAAENWAKVQGYRLLHLEVFDANKGAKAFYDKVGFKPDSLAMIKELK